MSDKNAPRPKRKRARDERTRKRTGRPRKQTISVKTLTKSVIKRGWRAVGGKPRRPLERDRPRTWGDCQATGLGERTPCPWVSCKYHLYLDVDPDTGSIILNQPDLEPWQITHTCALRVALLDGATLEEVGEIMNVTRERVRQIEVRALTRKLHGRLRVLRMDEV